VAPGKSSTKQVSKVTCGFFTAPNPVDLETVNENLATAVFEIVNETDIEGDAWIGQQ